MALVSNILTQVFITLIAVAGVYVLTGLTGMFSLGQAAFMAIGSYASGLLVVKAHMPLVPAIIIAVALATLVGYLIGYPVVRLRRDYISLVTLGFGEAIAALLNRKNYYFVPFGQDDPEGKPSSLQADFSRMGEAAAAALEGRQLQPVLR